MAKYFDNNGTKLWSTANGTGTPLILCNGGPGCDDFVRFEQRGCGRSDWDKHYDLDTTVGDIDFVRSAYGFNKVIVGGHSAGVGFSLAYALKHPDVVLGIVGISGGCIVNDRDWFRTYRDNLERHGEDNGGKEYKSDPDVNKDGNETWRAFIKNPTLLSDLSELDTKAVFINAGNDIRPNWPTIQLARLMKNSEYVEIAGAGHYIWVTHRDELRKELRTAIGKITAQQVAVQC